MIVLWPWLLLLFLLVPLLVAIYIWMLRRKRKYAVRYSSLSLIRAAMPERANWRQHVPFGLLLLGIMSLIFAIARPAAAVQVPLSRTSIILALDVSRSMCATDVDPNRFSVAQDAMLEFIADQADGTKIGVVAFAGSAEIIVPPTDDREQLEFAIANLTTALGTAMGSATLKAIDAIAENNPDIEPSGVVIEETDNPLLDEDGFAPDIIVLLTDGASTRGVDPFDAAQEAADRGVRVYTIGFGTTNPTEMICTQEQLGSDGFGGNFGGRGGNFSGDANFGGRGGFGDFRRFLLIDEPTLQGVADITGGTYYRAEDAQQLVEVFENLPTQIVLQTVNTEISFVFAALGALLTVVAVVVGQMWQPFP